MAFPLKHLAFLLVGMMLIAGCSNSDTANRQIAVTAEKVTLVQCAVKGGHASDTNLVVGLQQAANILSELYTNANKAYPDLKGNVRGMLQAERSGTIRLFMERKSQVSPEARLVINNFITATMAGTWAFPPLGEDCLIEVDFKFGE